MQDIAKYLYEMGQLKRVKRSGWWLAGIADPESVAEHSHRTAILGFLLAELAGADPQKTAAMCLFHDTAETRLNDFHMLAQRYIEKERGEAQALREQTERLPVSTAGRIRDLVREYEQKESLEARLAHDADRLECMIQAREYQMQGYADVQDWIDRCRAGLRHEVSQRLAVACLQVDPKAWWTGQKKAME